MANEDWDVTRDCGRGEPRAARGDFLVELRGFEPLTSAVCHTASRFSLYGFMRRSDK